MDFGLVFQSSVKTTPDDVVYAEQRGFTHAWLYDSQMIYSDVYVTMALCADRTTSIVLGTGVTNPLSRIAPVTANAFASLNLVAPGRLVIAIGTGNTARRTLGMPAAKVNDVTEHVRIFRDLCRGGTTDYTEGDRHRRIRFLNQDADFYNLTDQIPILIAGSGPRLLARAGELADGVMLFGPVSPTLTEFVMRHVRAGAERAGRNPDDLYVTCMTAFHVTEPGTDLESQEVRRAVGPFVASATNIFALSNPNPEDLPDEYREEILRFRDIYKMPDEPIETRHLTLYEDYLHGFRQEHADIVTEKLIKATTLTGTPDEIVASIKAMRDAGIDQVAIQPILDVRETAETFKSIIDRVNAEVGDAAPV
jgi:5,10-methylenetetrahydromethanopterin reductase